MPNNGLRFMEIKLLDTLHLLFVCIFISVLTYQISEIQIKEAEL